MGIRFTLTALIVLHGAVVFAGFLAPYDYAEQHRERPYAPPTTIGFSPWPYVYSQDSTRVYPIRFFTRGRLLGVDPGGYLFLLGTDGYGRDLFSRILYGGRVSLATGIVAGIWALALGLFWGLTAGFYGGRVDGIMMRLAEFFLALPWLYLLLGVRAFLPLHISPAEAFFLLVAIIGSVGWVRPARLVRGLTLSLAERPYVEAARAFGAGPLYLVRRHILPETKGLLLTQATILIPYYILAEVTLSFLGLGVGEPVPSWGSMLADARQYHALVAHFWMLAPGVATSLVLLGYIHLSDLLQSRS
ncbi:MAG TPA: ABC transporter permease [Candidatus Acidoferrales bacterium]|nr:ABC transporter permease [Candidatus Acidoferrales bacterium]